MHLYVAAHGTNLSVAALKESLRAAAAPVAALADAQSWSARSPNGLLLLAGLHHAQARLGPRRPVADDGNILVAYDGLPLPAGGQWASWDAAALRERRSTLHDDLEGSFSVLVADLQAERAEILTDGLGMAPAYRIDLPGGGRLLGSSLLALRWLADRHELDERGAAGFLTLGWTMGERTAVAGAQVLPGGAWTGVDGISRRHFDSADLIAQRRADSDPERAREELLAPMRALGASGIPVRCAVTAGRDSRLVLALCLAAGIDPVLYTGGVRGDADVEIGIAIANLLGRDHELTGPLALDALDASAFVTGYMAQNDGVSTLESLHDHVSQLQAPPTVDAVVTGIGGEIARAGTALAVPLSAVGRPAADVRAIQRRLLEAKLKRFDGLVRPQATALAREQLDAFVGSRRDEGWPVRAIGEAFYALERVGRWGSTGLRRGAATSDVISPLATGAFARRAFRHSAGERVVEAVHHRLLGALDPALRDAPFETKWAPQRPWLAEALVLRKAGRSGLGRVRGRLRRPCTGPPAPDQVDPFTVLWSGQLELHRGVVEEAGRDHQLFELVDREALLRRLENVETVDRGVQRALTLLWALERSPRRTHAS